jgi:hypothetical protein
VPRPRTFQGLSAAVFSLAKSLEDQAHVDYRGIEVRSGYWAMLDLRASASYRKRYGAESAFKRSVTFTSLVRRIASSSKGRLVVFKEMGDGMLLFSGDFRPIIELILLMDAVSRYWQVDVVGDASYASLELRAAVTYGEAEVLGDDFLGEPIDMVARLSSYSAVADDVVGVVSAQVRGIKERQYEVEYPFLRFGENRDASSLLKVNEGELWLSELVVDRAVLREFDDYFLNARNLIAAIDESVRFAPGD